MSKWFTHVALAVSVSSLCIPIAQADPDLSAQAGVTGNTRASSPLVVPEAADAVDTSDEAPVSTDETTEGSATSDGTESDPVLAEDAAEGETVVTTDEVGSTSAAPEHNVSYSSGGQVQKSNEAAAYMSASSSAEAEANVNPVFLSYFGILYGPSALEPHAWQPTATGSESDRPVYVKNYLTLGHNLNEHISLSASAYFIWRPVMGQEIRVRDPYLRVAHNSLVTTDNFNWYGDLRVHLAVSDLSRENDLLTGVQSFHIMTYQVGETRLQVGSYFSVRGNYFGGQGTGQDLELYAAPHLNYQVTPTLAGTLVYEMGASHAFGDPAWEMYNGAALQPGFTWDITPALSVNPYLNIYTGDKVTKASTSVGMSLYWQLF